MNESDFPTLEEIDAIAAAVSARTSIGPEVGLILGSGLGPLADSVSNADRIPTSEIEGWPRSTVEGHEGSLVIGELENRKVFILQGRIHFYEGYPMSRIVIPIRVMQRMGIRTLIVTNASGGIHPDFQPGDLMMLTDHINLIGMTGQSPLRGPNLDEIGPRFPDMSRAYDPDLMALARSAAADEAIDLKEGVYICLAGPAFETPADLSFLKGIGADAVGMSTVPEVTAARHGGMRVLGLSGISNKANMDGETVTTHDEVLEAGRIVVPKLIKIIRGVLRSL